MTIDTGSPAAISGGRSFIPPIEQTRSTALNEKVGFFRRQVGMINDDAHELHDELRKKVLDERAAVLAKQPAVDLLSRLYESGFAWRDLARMVGVSVPAIQKWRRGERATGENRLKLAELCGLVDMLSESGITDPASWFEIRIRPSAAITPIDICERGRYDLVLEWGTDHTPNGDVILDEFDSEWREKFVDANFEIFIASDGLTSIRPAR